MVEIAGELDLVNVPGQMRPRESTRPRPQDQNDGRNDALIRSRGRVASPHGRVLTINTLALTVPNPRTSPYGQTPSTDPLYRMFSSVLTRSRAGNTDETSFRQVSITRLTLEGVYSDRAQHSIPVLPALNGQRPAESVSDSEDDAHDQEQLVADEAVDTDEMLEIGASVAPSFDIRRSESIVSSRTSRSSTGSASARGSTTSASIPSPDGTSFRLDRETFEQFERFKRERVLILQILLESRPGIALDTFRLWLLETMLEENGGNSGGDEETISAPLSSVESNVNHVQYPIAVSRSISAGPILMSSSMPNQDTQCVPARRRPRRSMPGGFGDSDSDSDSDEEASDISEESQVVLSPRTVVHPRPTSATPEPEPESRQASPSPEPERARIRPRPPRESIVDPLWIRARMRRGDPTGILFVDLRGTAECEEECIGTPAIISLEPFALMGNRVTEERIDEYLYRTDPAGSTLFRNTYKSN